MLQVSCALAILAAAALPTASGAPGFATPEAASTPAPVLQASGLRIEMTAQPDALWTVRPASAAPAHRVGPPVFPLDGRAVTALPVRLERVGEPLPVGPDVLEHRFRGVLREDPSLVLEIRFRLSDLSPVVRFRYRLTATTPHAFSRRHGEDELVYLRTAFAGLPRATEVRLPALVHPPHGGTPHGDNVDGDTLHGDTFAERRVGERDFDAGLGVMGPILLGSDGLRTLVLGYEHGSSSADAFVRFDLAAGRGVTLRAVKGGTWRGQPLDAEHPYETIWLQAGLVAGDERRAAEAYRRFVREDMAAGGASREPTGPTEPRIDEAADAAPPVLAQIDAARRIGVETLVLGTGWSDRTGDWTVSRERFPEGLAPVRRKLDAYGMRLGLRLDPAAAAAGSRASSAHRGLVTSWRGESRARRLRDAGENLEMCLVSPWGEALLDALVRLHRETGVTSFEWDAPAQHCDAPGHGHGTAANTPDERAHAHAFRVGERLAELAERLAERVPGAVVDLDVTGGRSFGLALLRAGRVVFVDEPPCSRGCPARWIDRATASLDDWIPAELLPSHCSPVGSQLPRTVTLASLVLGQCVIRGDLTGVAAEDAALLARALGPWRQVRDSIGAASPVRAAAAGGVAEVREKIDGRGRGAIVVFSPTAGRRRYVSERPVVPEHWTTPGVRVGRDAAGRAVLEIGFDAPGAAVVLFGARER